MQTELENSLNHTLRALGVHLYALRDTKE